MPKKTLIAVLACGIGTQAAAQDNAVEVLHWWTSGGEGAALSVLKDALDEEGIAWNDMPVAGGAGTNAMTAVRSRVTAGNPPTAVQLLGYDITDWAEQDALGNLNAVAEAEDWETRIPEAIQEFSRYEGDWVAAPVNVHSTNWVWVSRPIMDEIGVTEAPASWDEFMQIAERVEEAGYMPFGYGGQPWQDAVVFDSIALGVGGQEWYQSAFVDLNPEAIDSDTMVAALERMGEIRAMVDENFSGRDWNLATAMVINNEAAFNIMGDWAKGEFLNAGLTPNEDFYCWRVPGTAEHVVFISDQFAMFDVGEERAPPQERMASLILSEEFQVAFNTVKGSVPSVMGISDAEFDACGQQGMADLAAANANGTLVGSQGLSHTNRAAVKNAFNDAISAYFNGDLSAEDAAAEMAETVAFASR